MQIETVTDAINNALRIVQPDTITSIFHYRLVANVRPLSYSQFDFHKLTAEQFNDLGLLQKN